MSKMLRINEKIAEQLKELTKSTSLSRQKIVERALEKFSREQFLKQANREYEALKKDPKAYKEYLDEMAEWDTTLLDGLEDEEFE